MFRVFIYACEGTYGGLHGIYNQCCGEVSSVEEAYDWGLEMAIGVVEDYDCFDEDDDYEPEYEVLVWRIRDDVILSTSELDAEAARHDYETFVEMYCESEVVDND